MKITHRFKARKTGSKIYVIPVVFPSIYSRLTPVLTETDKTRIFLTEMHKKLKEELGLRNTED